MMPEESEQNFPPNPPTEDLTRTEEDRPAQEEADEEAGLFESMNAVTAPEPGQVVRGTVLNVTESEVIVDVGLKCEGSIGLEEFRSEDGSLNVHSNAEIDVLIESYNEKEGTVQISYREARGQKAWEEVETSFRDQKTLTGNVIERVKGGLVVDIGLRAFLPGSQADVRPLRDLESLIGQEIACRVVKINKKRNNVVVSRKAVLEEEIKGRRTQLREKLAEGAVISGRVKNLTSYGAFLDLGGMDGLLHVTDISWGRVGHPTEVLKLDQELTVKVLGFDPKKDRVSLGLKQLSEDPWAGVAERYPVGSRMPGRISSLTDYGAFVELEPGVEGLVHISEMSWGKRLRHPSKVVRVGDRVEVAVLDINPVERRISLSLKQVSSDPWSTLATRYAEGAVVHGTVRNLTGFGAFVEIEEGVDGLIHLSDLSWNRRVKHPSEVLKKGQTVDVVVLKVDAANRRLSLGLKQLQPDSWATYVSRIQLGDTIRGRISRKVPFGAFVELEEGLEGLCHNSELEADDGSVTRDSVQPRNEHLFRVIKLNPEERKIGLSLRGVVQEPGPETPAEPPTEKVSEEAPADSPVAPSSSDVPAVSAVDASTLTPRNDG